MSISALLRNWRSWRRNAPQTPPADDWEPRSLELEWALKLLADAEQQERQEQCAARGHGKRHEVTSLGSPQLEYLCASCGAVILEDR